MLNYLTTSKTRRKLLLCLWRNGEQGSVSDLARIAGVAFAGAYRELKTMAGLGLVVSLRAGNATIYRANPAHPHAALLTELTRSSSVSGQARPSVASSDEDDRAVKEWLVDLGAPLVVRAPTDAKPPESIERAVAAGVALSRRDATVARVMPIVIWKNRATLDFDRLITFANQAGEKQTLGFLLDLTGRLADDAQLRKVARTLRDRRLRRLRDYFPSPRSIHEERLAERNTPRVAREWFFRMNMGLDSFESMFEKMNTRDAEIRP